MGLFAGAIDDVMVHLSAATTSGIEPFVQLSSLASHLGSHVRHSAHHWRDFQRIAPATDARLLLFVSPVDSPAAFCDAVGAPSGHCAQLAVNQPQMIVNGSAGACCDDATAGHPAPHHHSDPRHHAAQAAARRVAEAPDAHLDKAYATSHGLDVQYFGVVSQQRGAVASDSCYLIKTVQQRDRSACRCMHYSLMRVCQGSALAEQAMGFWA